MIKKRCSFLLSCFIYFGVSMLLLSCAQVVAPTGGEPDVVPPKVVKSNPENYSTNFSGKKIQINFSEYITLKDMNSQLLISPPLKNTPETNVKNKSLTVEFEDTLKPNTTYTFSFGNSIVDFTEGNALENYQFVFSTGYYLDSLAVTGNVQKAFDHSVEKGILVMLYALEKTSADSFPYHERPDYFGKTNDLGNYVINNIKPGKYKIFALKEGNSNYLFDSDDEQIGYVDSVLEITKSLSVDLSLFQEQKSKLYLKKPVKNLEGLLIVALSKPVKTIAIESLLPAQKFVWSSTEISANKDTLKFWYAGADGDSLKFKLLVNEQVLDTIEVKIPRKESNKGKGDHSIEIQIKTNVNSDGTLDLNKKIRLLFAQPIKKFNSSRILLSNRKDSVSFELNFIDTLKRVAELDAKLIADSVYKLFIPQGVFEDYNGLKNDTNRISFRMLTSRDYGTLKLNVKLGSSVNYLLQLLDEKENVLHQRTLSKSEIVFYEYLKPGTYKFKLLEDLNENKKWDTGKFLEKKQPEKIRYFGNTLTVRANWDLEEIWDLSK